VGGTILSQLLNRKILIRDLRAAGASGSNYKKGGVGMNTRTQILCALCGIVCPVIMGIGLWPAAGFIPPLPPSATATEIAAIYRNNATGINLMAVCFMISGGLYLAYTAAMAAQMRRMETRATPVLTYTQLGAGAASSLLFIIPAVFWIVAAYRPERDPETILVLSDLAWFSFVMPVNLGIVQSLSLGFAILGDSNVQPIFPRWVGFFNIWLCLLIVPGLLVPFFKVGPFAWNGLLAFWLVAVVLSLWFPIMSMSVIKAARRQALDSEA
jgi:hypothetical protein